MLIRKVFFTTIVLSICVAISGCEAKSTLTVELQEKASGEVRFELELDENAASTIRSDSYNAQSLEKIFNIDELKNAGFSVDVSDNKNGDPSKVAISSPFYSEKELENILSYLAPESVLSAQLISSETFLRENQNLEVQVNLQNLKDLYLQSDDIDSALQDAGIEKSEYESLLNSAFSSTTFELILKKGKSQKSLEIKDGDAKSNSIKIETSKFRTRFIFSLVGALAFAVAAIFVLRSIRRTPQLLSKESKFSKAQEQ